MKKTMLIRGAAAVWLAVAGASAWAQDYAVTNASGRWATPPVGASDVLPGFPARIDSSLRLDTLPFPIAYYGRTYSSMSIGTNGFVQFGGGSYAAGSFAAFPQSGPRDGVCAVAWGALDGSAANAQLLTWTDGTAPSRRFVVSWMNFQDAALTGSMSMQVQFYEATGRVVFAYAPTWTATSVEALGIDAVTTSATGEDDRFRTPDASALYTVAGSPGADFQFDPPNDAYEPNDSAAQAVQAGDVGFARTNLALAQGDQDWFAFHVSQDGGPVTADVTYDMTAYAATALTLEVRTAAGSVLALGSPAGASGPFRAVVPSLAAGDYYVRLRHDGGRAIAGYALQVYENFKMTTPLVSTWTAGRPFEAPVALDGGVAPYTIGIADWSVLPPGLVFDSVNMRVVGTPSAPGRYEFVWTCRDSGAPQNTAQLLQTVIVNPAMDVRLGEFTAFALGKSAARAVPSVGGTAPFACGTNSGSLPHGVTMDPAGLDFLGTPDVAGGSLVSIAATDSTGSSDAATTTAVVCAPMGAFDLAEGASASGVWFDALAGSAVKLSVTTAAGGAKRALRGVLLLPDGTTSAGANVTTHAGRAAVARFTAPVSGRYYFVVSSDSGTATSLVGSVKLAPALHGAGAVASFESTDQMTVELGAVAGATLSLTAKWGRSGPSLVVKSLIDPTGAVVAVTPANLKAGKSSLVLTQTLGVSGTWKVVLAGSQFGPGKVSYSYKLGQPRGAAYSAD